MKEVMRFEDGMHHIEIPKANEHLRFGGEVVFQVSLDGVGEWMHQMRFLYLKKYPEISTSEPFFYKEISDPDDEDVIWLRIIPHPETVEPSSNQNARHLLTKEF